MPDQAHEAIIQNLIVYAKKQSSKKQLSPFLSFLAQYYAHAPIEDLEKRTVANLYGVAYSHWQLIKTRKPGDYKRRIFNPSLETDGWDSSHTILQFIIDDQPFLVDTLCTEINRQGLAVHFVIHLGGMKVLRNNKHEAIKIMLSGTTCKGAITEAPIHIEIDRQNNPAILEKLGQALDRVVDDARSANSDWQKMEAQVYFALEDMEKFKPPLPEVEVEESKAFLRWLLDNRFTFLGFRRYDRIGQGDKQALKLVTHSALGVLRDTRQSLLLRYFSDLPKEAQDLACTNEPILLAKTNTRSTVHGGRYTDFICIKRFNQEGDIIGERWFIGLYTNAVYNEDPKNFPIIRQKFAAVLKRSELPKEGYAYKALVHILKTLPRDDLFHASVDELFNLGIGILQLQDRRCIRLFARQDIFRRFISCLVYVPRDDFNMELCYRMEEILKLSFDALEISYTTAFSDSILARIHFTVRINPKKPPIYDLKSIEQKLIEVGRSWKEGLREQLIKTFGEEKGNILFTTYGRSFQASYRETFSPETAIQDILHLEQLISTYDLQMCVYRPQNAPSYGIRFKLYHKESTIPLSDAIPILEKIGLRVIGEQPYQIIFKNGDVAWINDFNMQQAQQKNLDLANIGQIFQEAFKAVWYNKAEHDGFNALVLTAQLPWHEIALLRAYAKYLKQIGIPFSQDYVEQALCNNPTIATLLVQLFLARFDPSQKIKDNSLAAISTLQTDEIIIETIKNSLEKVANLDEDRILRLFLNLIQATVRTNYFQTDNQNQSKSYISFKFDSLKIQDLPLPRPLYEIFVYSSYFEGIHLRTNRVSRGGLRWSERREDFRLEILGLMKAQQVKNAVIVPAGAKGGFVVKLIPLTADRDMIQKEGIRCYQNFICGLLDLTDNLIHNQLVHPEKTVCFDEEDPYLVVAADKGTASFSDIANQISKEYRYWLGDAFASGGSTGYDHKKIAITSRGCWESVKRHFQEINCDITNTPFTVIGIGDMSGDVFGNSLLLSKQIKLIAAFNGIHIFVDPTPDPAISFKERQRLFDLPRSSWEDYNPKLISKGGGVFKRSEKSIKLSPELKKVLDVAYNTLTPNELIQAILKAPLDLLLNGGIGTFVKAQSESHLEVGDRASDGIRINAIDLRCRIVGEGGNLGFTQLGRIEYALHGGLINTDFIDNSGGVDCSDHEVNIKILLNERVMSKQMTLKQRDRLLAKMQDDVVKLVLHNNYRQARAVSIATQQSNTYLNLYERYLKEMCKQGKIDRQLESLPSDEILATRRVAQLGLTAPEIAVLLAYSKIILKTDILHSDIADDPYLGKYLFHAFPPLLSKAPYAADLSKHRLRLEIVATQLSNLLITDMGITFVYQMQDETGASVSNIVRAYIIALEMFQLQILWETIESLPISAQLLSELSQELVRLMRRSVRWLLRNQRDLRIQKTLDLFSKGIKQSKQSIQSLLSMLTADEKTATEVKATAWVKMGVPKEVAIRLASARSMYSLLNIIKITNESKGHIQQIARLYFELADCLDLNILREKINDYPTDTHWMLLARSAAKNNLDFQQRALTLSVYQFNKKYKMPLDSLSGWVTKNNALLDRWKYIFGEMKTSTSLEYAILMVILRELSELTQAALSAQ